MRRKRKILEEDENGGPGREAGMATTQTSNIYVCSDMDKGGSSVKQQNTSPWENTFSGCQKVEEKWQLFCASMRAMLQCFKEAFHNLDLKIWKV